MKRRCRASSLSRTQVALRSFQLFPSTVDFGTLAEGSSASVTVRMKNVGVDLCRYEQQIQVICGSRPEKVLTGICLCSGRFQVKQPPLKTGLRVLYTPGPVGLRISAALRERLLSSCVNVSLCRCLQGCTLICSSSCWRRLQVPQEHHRPASTTIWSSRLSWKSSTCPSLLISFKGVLVISEGL